VKGMPHDECAFYWVARLGLKQGAGWEHLAASPLAEATKQCRAGISSTC
jgi:hypothetical protein